MHVALFPDFLWYPTTLWRQGSTARMEQLGRNQCVTDWVKLNLGDSSKLESEVYLRLWRLGAEVARGFGNVLERSELDDSIHDVMVRISRREDVLTFDYPAAYFCRAVKHACLSRIRTRKSDRLYQPFDSDDGEAWENTLRAEDASLDIMVEHAQCMRDVLRRLTPEQQENLRLAIEIRVHGMAAEVVAEDTGRSPRAITQAVSNFVKVTLRKLLEEVCPGLVQQVTGRLG